MELFKILKENAQVFVSVAVVGTLLIMLMPIPPFFLDIFLSFSIAIAIVIIITGVYIQKPLDFSVFPTVLLITTLFRLSLNVATTRLILLNGEKGIEAAGKVIASFGAFVIGGNFAIGLIIFSILVIVNFVVITKGSGRIAEVAARFTLDGMPGKQMAIDADLNSGLIDEQEAKRRREEIAREADFYGSMDGASKFVRGDAVAGLIITAINIVGGLLIGVLQKDMLLVDAATTYTVLTVGDGLVSQIPALLISTAAGMVVTRAGKEADMGQDIAKQLVVNPKSLYTASGILGSMALVPGMPFLPFLLIAGGAAGTAYALTKSSQKEKEETKRKELAKPQEPSLESYMEIDPLTLEIGYGLIPLVEEQKGELLGKIKSMRRQLAREIGFVAPSIHIRDNLQLRPHEYSFMIRNIEVAKNEVMMAHWLAVASEESSEQLEGIPAKEPAFGLPALWIEEKLVEKAQLNGYMVVDTATVIATHLTELIRKYGWELLTRAEVQSMLDNVSKTYPKLVDELIPQHLTLGNVQRILQNLLKERVPINDLVSILEAVLDYAPNTKDVETLTEFSRQALSRYITKQYTTPDGNLPVFTLDPRFESQMAKNVQTGEAISPEIINRLVKSIEVVTQSDSLKGIQPVLLCSPHIRRFVRRILEKFMPSVVVLSSAEVSTNAKLFSLGVVKYEN